MAARKKLTREAKDRLRRMKWWHDARFGMFIHWGLYSVLGRHEWAMEMEGIPLEEYESLADRFRPKEGFAAEWVALAKRAGMKYMVLTTKHHDGFCLFNSELTDYCAPKRAAGRDLVAEYVEAARAEGMGVGFYHSLMDWHHPDGAMCAESEAARQRYVGYLHGQIRELLTNYGTIDILWYDVPWPLDAEGWESKKMNRMVFKLQPDIIVNNRNRLPGDFSTPEQHLTAEPEGRAWEACMTMNGSWGYHKADDSWKSPKQIVRNLIQCARDGGNYLLNIGPRADGSVPAPSVRILTEVGDWMDRYAATVRTPDRCAVTRSLFANFTRRGKTLYVHVHYWPGDEWAVAGLRTKVKAARLLPSGEKVRFEQDRFRVKFSGLPKTAPEKLVSVLELECASVPKQDMEFVRRRKPRGSR